MVSFSVSPLVELEVEASENPITLPPKRLTAVSKLSRVRVDGSKKRVAATLPFKISWLGLASNVSAKSRICKICSLEKSVIDTRFLLSITRLYFNRTKVENAF